MEVYKHPHLISQEYIRDIITMDDEPILRNLKITQCYYDLSQAIAQRIGNENVNWCTFATWASKTAGRFIRMEDLNIHLHKALHNSGEYNDWILLIREKFNELEHPHEFGHHSVLAAAENTISLISADIAAGNLKVFSELGPVFSSMIDAFDKSIEGDREAVEIVLSTLQAGATSDGGQDYLHNAIRDFHAALHESDPCLKAEWVLRANAQTGLHEQIRLQPYIAGAMEAPFPDTFSTHFHSQAVQDAPAHSHHIMKGMFSHLLSPIVHRVHDVWLNLSTHYLMTLSMPDGVLHLGHNLPNLPGLSYLFPDHLTNPQDPELIRLLMQYEAHLNDSSHSRAKNWAKLEDRMHFILYLFRSRQQHKPLHEPPFEEIQKEHIYQNKIPKGRL